MTRTIEPTNNDFSFVMEVTKGFTAEPVIEGPPKMMIRGVASSTKRDKQHERFSLSGLAAIKKAIEDGIYDEDGSWSQVPLRNGHREEWNDILGYVTKAEIDEEENLWITAELDEDNDQSRLLYKKLTKGNANGIKPKLGLSVRGQVTKYRVLYDPEIQKAVPHFDNITMSEVSVTARPVNPPPYPLAIAKSLYADPEYRTALEETMDNLSTKTLQTQVAEGAETREDHDPIAMAFAKAEAENVEEAVVIAEDAVVTEEVVDAVQVGEKPHAAEGEENVVHEEVQVTADTVKHPVQVAEEAAHEHEGEGEVADAEVVATEVVATPNNENLAEDSTSNSVVVDRDALAQLVAAVTALTSALGGGELQAVEAQKAETVDETPAASVTLTQSDEVTANIETLIGAAVEKALKPYLNELSVVKSEVKNIATQPIDRSISVSKAKESANENDPFDKMTKLKQRGQDSIGAAFAAADYDDRKPW